MRRPIAILFAVLALTSVGAALADGPLAAPAEAAVQKSLEGGGGEGRPRAPGTAPASSSPVGAFP